MLAVDTEATGLDQYAPGFRVFMAQWADAEHEFVCDERAGWAPFLAAIEPEDVLVFANASYDIHALRESGIVDLLAGHWRIHDVQTLARVVLPGRFSYRLESLGDDLLGKDSTESQRALKDAAKQHELRWTKEEKDYLGLWQAEPALMERYGKEDVRLTWALWHLLWARATPADLEVYRMEIAGVAPLLREAEREGVLVDKERLATLRERMEEARDDLQDQLLAHGFSEEALGLTPDGKASSTALLADLQTIGVPLYRMTPKGGKLAVNKDALKEFELRYPAVKDLLAWRSANTILRTYVGALERANPRIHTSFSQAEARTVCAAC
jgi:DNA polymerase I-like protein with 3'-5' exonuclease and polymerase domains